MGENEKTLRWFVDTIDDLEKQRSSIDEKIAALDLAYEALTGSKRAEGGGLSKPRSVRMKRRTLDKAANEKTLAFLQKRAKATSITAIAREFRIKRSAANQRCLRLVEFGWARRSAAGMYEAVEPAVAKAA